MATTISSLRAGLAAIALLVTGTISAAAQEAAAPSDTVLLVHAATKAREKVGQLAGSVQPADARAAAQYREALGEFQRGAWRDAATRLEAALARARANPLYRGDLAYAQARLGLLDDAHNSYVLAYQGLNQNAWYLVGLAAVRWAKAEQMAPAHRDSTHPTGRDSTLRAEWEAAAGTLQFAVQNDSSLIDSIVAISATRLFLRAGYRPQAAEWARIATPLAPDFAEGWMLIAETDSVNGLAAARRYVALRPNDPRGQAYLAIHMINAGQTDSAMQLAAAAASDSAFRPAAAEIYLVAGIAKLRTRDFDGALALFGQGRAWAAPAQRPSYAYYTGRAQLVKVTSVLGDAEEQRSCAAATRADTLVADAERNLREGIALDSARVMQLITDVIPQYHTNAENFARDFCRPQPQQRPAAPRRRP